MSDRGRRSAAQAAWSQETVDQITRILRASPGGCVTEPGFPADLARLALDDACDLVAVHDRDGVYLYLSEGLARWGHRPAEVVGHHPAEYVHPEDRARFLAELPPAVKGNRLPVRYRVRCGDGTYRLVESRLAPVRVEGRVALVITATRDVQEVHDRALREREHAESLAALGALAAGAAHEINNPLTWILANLDEALEGLEETSRGKERLDDLRERLLEAREGVVRVGTLAREMKHLGRRHADGRAVVDLRQVLDAALGVVWNQLRHRAVLTKDYGSPPLVTVNDARLGQVFVNLLLNAVQALPEGRESSNAIRLVTGTTAEGDAFADVIDNGPGIPREARPRIFEPFFTTKPEGVGTGLGLAVCKGIVEEAGGTIEVESQAGVGTRFRVRIPAAAEEETTPAQAAAVAEETATAGTPAPELPAAAPGASGSWWWTTRPSSAR